MLKKITLYVNIKSRVLVCCTVIQPLRRKETSYAHAKDPKPDLEEKEGYAAEGCGLHERQPEQVSLGGPSLHLNLFSVSSIPH